MKFVISSTTLSSRLNIVGRVIAQKNTSPILDCFCCEIKDNKLTVTASDNDSTVSSQLELNESDADVRFAVNAKTFQDALKEIPEQPLNFDLNTDTYELTIEYQNGQYKLLAQDAEDYPTPSIQDEEHVNLTVSASSLLSGVTSSLVAAANDVLRPQLNAVCFDIKEGYLSLVASNGNQLALTKIFMGSTPNEGIFLLNTRPATLLKNILAKEQGDVVMNFGAHGVTFTSNDYHMICSLVTGRYPNYRSVIPNNNPNVVTINRQALISVLRRVLVFANPSAVLVRFNLSAGTLHISSQDTDFGKSAEEKMFCDYSAAPMRIAFKGSTLLELIQNIESEEITMELSDPSRAGLIMPTTQKENEQVLMLIMPSVFND